MIKDGYKLYKSALDPRQLHDIKSEAIEIFNYQIENYLDSPEKDNFENNLIKLFRTAPGVVKNCGKIIQNLVSLRQLEISYTILNLIQRDFNIKFPVISTKPVLYFMNKNLAEEEIYYKTPVHRDFPSIQASLNGVVAWAPLVPTKPVGSLQVIPGSHLRKTKILHMDHSFGVENDDNYREDEFLSVDMEPGDLVLFSSNLIHRSGNNTTEDRIRWSVSFRYADAMCQNWIQRNYTYPYTYKSNVEIPYKPSPLDMEKVYG